MLLAPDSNYLNQGMDQFIDPYSVYLSQVLTGFPGISGRPTIADRGTSRGIPPAPGVTRGQDGGQLQASPTNAPSRGGYNIVPLPGLSVPIAPVDLPRPQFPTRGGMADSTTQQLFGRGDATNRSRNFGNLFSGIFPY